MSLTKLSRLETGKSLTIFNSVLAGNLKDLKETNYCQAVGTEMISTLHIHSNTPIQKFPLTLQLPLAVHL